MSVDLERSLLEADVEDGNVGMVLEHAADANLSAQELKEVLVKALRNRALQKEWEAVVIDSSWGEKGKGNFEAGRAKNLRKLAQQILDL